MFELSPEELDKRRLTEILDNEINDMFLRQLDPGTSPEEYDRLQKKIDHHRDLLNEMYPYLYQSAEQWRRDVEQLKNQNYDPDKALIKRCELVMKIFMAIIIFIIFIAVLFWK